MYVMEYIMEYFSAIKKNEILLFVMGLEVMLSEIRRQIASDSLICRV